MAASIRGSATGVLTDTGAGPLTVTAASLSPAAPSAGDVLVAFVNVLDDAPNSSGAFTPTTPTGWTVGLAQVQGSSLDWVVVYTRTATGTTADNLALPFSIDGTGQVEATVVAVQGSGTPSFGSRALSTGTTTVNVPSQGSTGDLLLINAANWVGGGASASFTTVPSGMSTTTSATSNGTASPAILTTILYSAASQTSGARTVTTSASTSYTWATAVSFPAASASAPLFVPQTSRPTVRVPRALRSVQSKIRVARLGPSSPSPIPQFRRSRRPSLVRRANMRVSSPRLIGKQTVNVPQVKLKRTLLPMRPRALRRSTPPIIPPSPTIRGFASGSANGNISGTITINASTLSTVPVAGDQLIAFVHNNNANNNTSPTFGGPTPTGWTIAAAQAIGATSNDFAIVYKRTATATTADNFVLNFSGDASGFESNTTVIVVTLANAGTPVFTSYVSSQGVGNKTVTVPSVGTTGDLLLVSVGAFPWSSTSAITYGTNPSGMSAVTTLGTPSGNAPESSILYQQVLGTPGTKTVSTTLDAAIMGIGVSVPYAATVGSSSSFIPQTKYSRKAPPVRLTALRVANPLPAAAATVTPTFIPQNTRIRTTPPRTTRRLGVSVPVITANTYVPIPNRLRYARPKPLPTRTKVSSPVATPVTATPPTFVPQNKIKRAGVPVKGLTKKVATPVPTAVVATPPVFIPQTKVKRVISPFRPRSMRVASPFLAGLQTVNVPQVKTKRITSPYKSRSMRTSVPVPPVVTATPPTFIPQTKTKRPAAPMRTRPTRVFSPVFPTAGVVAPTFIPQAKVRRAALPLRPLSLRANNPVVPAKALVPGPIRLRHARPKPIIRRGIATPVQGLSLSVSVTDNAGVFESRTNLAPNPSGEVNTSGWNWQSQSSGDTATVSQNATSPLYGSFVIRALITAPQTATSNHGMQIGSSGTVSAGDTITASVWIRPSRTNVFKFGLDFTGGGNSAAATAVSCPAGVWTQISATGVAAAGTTGVVGNLWTNSAGGSVFWQTNDTIDFDGLLIEKAATVGDFVDTTVPSVTYSFVKSSTLTDVAGTSDAASTLLITGAPVTDNAGVSDLATTSVARGGVVTDDSGTNDQATPDLLRGTTLTDRTTMYDRVTTLISHTKSVTVTDQSGVSDTTYAYLVNRPHGSWGAQINRSHG